MQASPLSAVIAAEQILNYATCTACKLAGTVSQCSQGAFDAIADWRATTARSALSIFVSTKF